MKKSIAIICAIAVMLSALVGTYMLADAQETNITVVELPVLGGTLNIGEAAGSPVYTSSNLPLTVVEDASGFPLSNLFKYDGVNATGWTKGTMRFEGNSSAVGMMFYVEAPASSHLNPYLNFFADNNNLYKFTGLHTGKWYLLGEEDTAWQPYSCATQNCGINIPAGFKGYMYVPYTAQTLSLNGGMTYTIDKAHPITSMTIELLRSQNDSYGYVPEGESFIFSAPMWVTSGSANDIPSTESVSIGGTNYEYFGAESIPETPNEDKYGLSDVSIVSPATLVNAPKINTGNTVTKVACPGGITTDGVDGWQLSGNRPNLNFDFNTAETKDAVAVMFYVKANTNVKDSYFTFGGYDATGTDKWWNINQVQGKVYTMAKGATTWTEVNIDYYYFQLAAGFEGYVKVPFRDVIDTNASGKDWTFDEDGLILERMSWITYSNVADGDLVISTPVLVYQEGSSNKSIIGQIKDLTTGDNIAPIVPGTTLPPEGGEGGEGGETPDPNPGGGEGGEGGETPDPNPDGGEGGETPAVQPEYKLPAYTGEAIDYSDFSLNSITVAIAKGANIIGSAPSNVSSAGKEDFGIADGNITLVESIVGITNYPSFKVNKDGGTYAQWLNFLTISHDTSKTKGAVELWHYVKLPAGKSGVKMHTQYNFTVNGDDNANLYSAYIYNGKASIMKKGETEWTEVDVVSYCLDLPSGFEGYVKYNIKSLYATGGGSKEQFNTDTEKELKTTGIKLFGLDVTDDVYIAPTVIVTKSGVVPYGAFVDGETNAARNIFTGKVLTTADLGGYEGEQGSGDLNQDTVPEIDYKIPAYTGSQEVYGNYLFARIKQFDMIGNVAKGYVVPQEFFTDGHLGLNNDYTKLVDPLIGISKMPFFSITKTTGSPAEIKGEPSVTVGTWHPDYASKNNTNCGAILQYIKLPSDLEKPYVGIYMNVYDENMMSWNITPYSGTVYFMPKGTTEWQTVKITAYWFELPKGFEGFVMLDTKRLITNPGSNEWTPNFNVYNYILRVANLKNQTVVASAPFWADSIGDIDYACYLNDETKAVRDIFTGKILKKDDIIKPLNIGDTIVKLPDYTTELSVGFSDEAALADGKLMLEWAAIDNAAKYTVRVFKKTNSDDGIAYTLFKAEDTTETTINMEGLDLNTQYAVVVYAYNANNDEIAVFDYINASTAAGGAPVAPVKPTTPGEANKKPAATEEEETGLSQTTIILIVVGAVVLALAIAVVVTILLIKKRKAKANN